MSSVLRVAASGVLAQQVNLEVIANNLANMNTNGFKRVRTEFADLAPAPLRYVAGESFPIDDPNWNDVLVGTGVEVAATQRLFAPGAPRRTDQPLDVAILGEGFLPVSLPDGNIVYTRDGALSLDGDGHLVTQQGYHLVPDLAVPVDAQEVQIDNFGRVWTRAADGTVQVAGTIQLARFANPSGLAALGHNVFQATGASGAPVLGQPGENGLSELMPGALEGSNVDLAEEVTRMIEAQRAYEMSIKAVQTLDEMLGLANALRR